VPRATLGDALSFGFWSAVALAQTAAMFALPVAGLGLLIRALVWPGPVAARPEIRRGRGLECARLMSLRGTRSHLGSALTLCVCALAAAIANADASRSTPCARRRHR